MQKIYTAVFALALMTMSVAGMAVDDGVPRITKEELKAKMDKGEDVIVLDVRTGGSYTSSKIKIKGAVRFVPNDIDVWSKSLPKNKEIVTYCT